MVGMRCADLPRETIGWRVRQPRVLDNKIAEQNDSLTPLFFRRRGSVCEPTLRRVCRIDTFFIPKSFQL